MDFTTDFLPLSVNGLGIHDDTRLFLQITADMDAIDDALASDERFSGINAIHEDPHIRSQLNILREATDNLQSAMSVPNGPISRTFDRVRTLIGRDATTNTRSSRSVGAMVSYRKLLSSLHAPKSLINH